MENSSLRPSRLYPHDVFSGSHGWCTVLSAHIQDPAAGTAHDSASGFLAIFPPIPQRQTRGRQNRHAVAGTDAIRNVDVRHVASKLLVPATLSLVSFAEMASSLSGCSVVDHSVTKLQAPGSSSASSLASAAVSASTTTAAS